MLKRLRRLPRTESSAVLGPRSVGSALSLAATLLCGLGWSQHVSAQAPAPSGASPVEPSSPVDGQPPAPAAEAPAVPSTEPAPADLSAPPAGFAPAPAVEAAPAAVASTEEPAPAVEAQADAVAVDSPPERGPFSRGGVRLSVLVGTGWVASDEYLILGAGLGYFVADGLELGLDYQVWMFGDPTFHRLSPGVRYVFPKIPVLKPYVGVFYRHTFVSDYDDFDQLGARVGAYLVPKKRGLFFGAGAVYERVLDCDDSVFSCDSVYPEITFGVTL